MLTRVLFLLFILLLLPDAYIYMTYVRKWTTCWWKRALFFVPSLALLIYLFVVLSQDDFRAVHQPMVGTLMMVFLTITVPKMLFTLFDSAGMASGKLAARVKPGGPHDNAEGRASKELLGATVRRYVRLFAMALGLCSVFMILYGYFWGRNRYEVNEQEIYFEHLPSSFDGYRILHFSDLHIGTFDDGHRSDVNTIAQLINNQKCDKVVFTGKKETENLYTRYNDYDMYLPFERKKEKKADIEQIKSAERSYGWTLLLNENRVIRRGNDSIAVIGSENDGLPPWPALGDLPKATKGLKGLERSDSTKGQPHTFSVLLTHDPTHWRRNVLPETRIDLTLAGHTHAGQFKVLGWSPIRHKYREWSGVYTEGEQVLNVTDGFGQILLPFRFGAWPEADVIVLKKYINENHDTEDTL